MKKWLTAVSFLTYCLPASFKSMGPKFLKVGIYQNEPKIFLDEDGKTCQVSGSICWNISLEKKIGS